MRKLWVVGLLQREKERPIDGWMDFVWWCCSHLLLCKKVQKKVAVRNWIVNIAIRSLFATGGMFLEDSGDVRLLSENTGDEDDSALFFN